jgi:hypothetical protein
MAKKKLRNTETNGKNLLKDSRNSSLSSPMALQPTGWALAAYLSYTQ